MDKIIIYCDGSCLNNQSEVNFGGWGAVIQFKDQIKEIYGGEKNTTNQRMELLSCIKALELLKSNKYIVEVYSDSAYLINCMQQGWYKKWQSNGWRNSQKKPVENKDLWEQLIVLIEGFNINFNKIKGHSGNNLNEKVDQLAQKGAYEIKEKENEKN